MTIQLASSFITSKESTTPRHRITEQKYLPQNLANLDLYAFDASSQETCAINKMKMGYDNKNTPRERDGRNRTPEWRPRSTGRERTPDRGQSPGSRSRPRSDSRHKYDQPYPRQMQRQRSASRNRIEGCLRCGSSDHLAEKCTLEYSAEKCPTGCGYFHKERDCPGKKSSGTRQSRSSFGPNMAYRRYRTPGGRSTSYTRNDQGQKYREMVSPGGSRYREFRRNSRSGERRPPNTTKPGTRQGRSPGRQGGTAYRVQTVAVEEQTHSHKDEYTSPNLYASPQSN